VNLLCDVLFEGKCRDLRRRNTSEGQQLWSAHQLWVTNNRVTEADVNRNILKCPSRKLRGDV